MKKQLTYERAHELYQYMDGVLVNKIGRQRAPKGAVVGTPDGNGYLIAMADGVRIKVHRIVWLMHYGSWPTKAIDHVNGDRSDNRIENLRDVDQLENSRNQQRRSTNSSGVTGVFWNYIHRKWQASISVEGKKIFLGRFSDICAAEKARKDAEAKYGFHPNHGRNPVPRQ